MVHVYRSRCWSGRAVLMRGTGRLVWYATGAATLVVLLVVSCGLPSRAVLGPTLDPSSYERDIIAVGEFFSVNGLGRANMARLARDGTVREFFSPTFNGPVLAVTVMTIGNTPIVLAGGAFTQVNGEERIGIAVLDTDGTLRPELARLLVDDGSNPGVAAILPVPERNTVILGGSWENVYEHPDDPDPVTDGRYASLAEVEWPGGAVRQEFLAGATLGFGSSIVRDLARGIEGTGWTVAVAGELSVDTGGAIVGTVGAILDATGGPAAWAETFEGVAFTVDADANADRYIYAGQLVDPVPPDTSIFGQFSVAPFELTGSILQDTPDTEGWAARALPDGRALAAGTDLFFPDTGVIVVDEEGFYGDFSGEIGPGEVVYTIRLLPTGIYLGGTFTGFLTRDLATGSVAASIPAGGLVRLRYDLSLDTGFIPFFEGEVIDVVELPPGTP